LRAIKGLVGPRQAVAGFGTLHAPDDRDEADVGVSAMAYRKLKGELTRLARDRGGNFAMMFGVSSLAILMSAGLAVEYTRSISERSAMANALDAAVLATARGISMGEIAMKDAEEHLRLMFIGNLNKPDGATADYRIENVVFDPIAETVSASAAYTQQGLFRFFGENNTRNLTTGAAATYGSNEAEVAMTFDVTGSMKGNKLANLKTAALAGVDQLLEKNRPGSEKIRISAIPYAEAVNVGSMSPYVFPDLGGPFDAPLSLGDFLDALDEGLISALTTVTDDLADSIVGTAAKDTCATERKGEHRFSPVGPDIAMVNRDARLGICPTATLVPLTADGQRLRDTINSFRADGVTAGQIGIQWAWYTLSTQWSEYLPQGSRPSDDDDVKKYAVIMTDGEFNTAFAEVPENEATTMRQGKRSSETAVTLCTRMKEEGIEIFTIGFQLRETAAIETLRACASPDRPDAQFFYDASTGAELTNAYRDIASTIQALRLVR
jgi:Flp pilus assembly protein TadG